MIRSALPAACFRQDKRSIQSKRNNVLVVKPLHSLRNIKDSAVDALADRRVPHVQSSLAFEVCRQGAVGGAAGFDGPPFAAGVEGR